MALDLTDVRVLIPRVRRGLDGPVGSGFASGSSPLNDSDMTAVIADAIADVILYTGGLFGHQLIVVERDENYGAPIQWKTSEELTEPEGTVIVVQAQLNYIFRDLKAIKIQETISREGQSWSWQLSATALADWLKDLRAARDKALEQIADAGHAVDGYESFLQARDQQVALLIEPWVSGNSTGGLELVPHDPRFY